MTDIVKGMVREYERVRVSERSSGNPDEACQEAMRAALLWFADNINNKIVRAARNAHNSDILKGVISDPIRVAISAATRAAAGEEWE
jgi:hypothetical protein